MSAEIERCCMCRARFPKRAAEFDFVSDLCGFARVFVVPTPDHLCERGSHIKRFMLYKNLKYKRLKERDKNIMLIDVHAHYDDKRFNDDRDEVIKMVKESGVDRVINCGSSIKSSRTSVDLAKKYDFIYAAVGVHPHDTARTPENTLDILYDLLKNKKVLAVGEIGLDFFRDFSDRDSQRWWFKQQMDFVADVQYPVVIHDRDAHKECLDMVKKYKGMVKGIFHCFAGSVEMARELIKLDYMMSFGGVVTFTNAKLCQEVVREIPIDYILLETDCPYLTPHPHRSERNDSSYLPLIAEKIAEIKNMTVEDVIYKTGENAKRCFNIT